MSKMHGSSEYIQREYRSVVVWDQGWVQGLNAMGSKEFGGLQIHPATWVKVMVAQIYKCMKKFIEFYFYIR